METRFKHHETPWLSQLYPTGAIGTIFSKFLGGAGRVRLNFVEKILKIEIFSILDIYAHNFKSSGALENKYYATKKWLESGLQYQDSIEHNIRGYMESSNWRYIGWWNPTPPPPNSILCQCVKGSSRVMWYLMWMHLYCTVVILILGTCSTTFFHVYT